MVDNNRINWQGWETVGLIGRGSFGDVYEIKREVFDDTEKAALKIISIPQNSKDIEEMYNDGYDEESVTGAFESHLKSILAEYTLMRKMSDCVNIVRCDDVNYEHHEDGIGWNIFIRMELLTPLTKALPVAIPEETVIKLAKDICNALDCCKKYNVIHRDIKPQNIFVSENGDYKLGDFGIAKTVEKTMGGTKIGTYKYMAPEVYNNQPYGTSADIYSLGLVLYWMLNNRRMPFVAANSSKMTVGIEEESRNRRLSGEKLPEPATGSKELKAVVMKACAYNPKDRYSSAREMLDELNELGKEHIEMLGTITVVKDDSIAEENKNEDDVNKKADDDIKVKEKNNEKDAKSFDSKSREKKVKSKKTHSIMAFLFILMGIVLLLIAIVIRQYSLYNREISLSEGFLQPLECYGDDEYCAQFIFVPKTSGLYVVNSYSADVNSNPRGIAYDKNWEEIGVADDSYESLDFELRFDAKAGKPYYLQFDSVSEQSNFSVMLRKDVHEYHVDYDGDMCCDICYEQL